MSDWPTEFDFENDDICQEVFKPFIKTHIEKLKDYDALRPDGHVYRFHAHSERVAQNVCKTCLHLNLGETAARNMYWAVLPHDIGKMSLPVEIWDSDEKPDGDLKAYRRTHTSTGAEIVQNADLPDHPFKDLMLDIMLHHHETMDGTGHFGIPGKKLSKPVRLTCIADSYDGWRIRRPHYEDTRDTSPAGVIQRIKDEKGAAFFDMDLVKAFEEMKLAEYKAKHEPFYNS